MVSVLLGSAQPDGLRSLDAGAGPAALPRRAREGEPPADPAPRAARGQRAPARGVPGRDSTLLSRLSPSSRRSAPSRSGFFNVLPAADRRPAGRRRDPDRRSLEAVGPVLRHRRLHRDVRPSRARRAGRGAQWALLRPRRDLPKQTGVEKIKTVSNAYLVVGGLGGLGGETDHAVAIAETALLMVEQVEASAGLEAAGGPDRPPRLGPVGGRGRAGTPQVRVRRLGRHGERGQPASRPARAAGPHPRLGRAGRQAAGWLSDGAARRRGAQGQGPRHDEFLLGRRGALARRDPRRWTRGWSTTRPTSTIRTQRRRHRQRPAELIRSIAHRLAGDRVALPGRGAACRRSTGATGWLNSEPLTPEGLRGRVVLVDFWTYTCVNWLRTLPYVRAWAAKYARRRPDHRRRPHPGVRLRARRRQRRRAVARPSASTTRSPSTATTGSGAPSPTTTGRRSTSPTPRAASATTTSARASTR